MKTVIEQLKDFLVATSKNHYIHNRVWLQDDKMEVYVRAARHFIDNKSQDSLDIANIRVFEEGKGTFKNFLAEAVSLNPFDVVYIENIHNPRLVEYLEREGWRRVQKYGDFVPSFYCIGNELPIRQ